MRKNLRDMLFGFRKNQNTDGAPAALLTEAGTQPKEQLSGAVTASEVMAAVRTGTLPDRPRLKLPQQGDKALRLLARVKDIDPSVRALRIIPPGDVSFRLQAAGHTVDVNVTVLF